MRLACYFLAIFGLAMSAPLNRAAHAPPEIIGFWRMGVAGVLILPFVLRKGHLARLWREERASMWTVLASAGLFFVHIWTYSFAAQHTKIAHCMILFATNPLFTALGARLFFAEPFTRRHLFAYILAALGIFQMVQGSLEFDPALLPGDLVALLSSILFSAFLLTGKKARQKTDNLSYSAVIYLGSSILFALTALIGGRSFVDYGTETWLSIAGLVILPTFLGHALFTWLMASMNINLMSCGKLVEPILSAIAAYFAFGEQLRRESFTAFVFTAAAIIVLFSPWRRPAGAEAPPRSTP